MVSTLRLRPERSHFVQAGVSFVIKLLEALPIPVPVSTNVSSFRKALHQ